MKKLFVLIFISLFLIACDKIVTLEEPSNIHLEDRVLKWDEVINATGYYIVINDIVSSTNTNSYDFSSYEDGEYRVKVKAFAEGFVNSDYSDLFTFSLTTPIIPLNPPSNLKIEDGVLSWDEVGNVKRYVVKVDNKLYQTANNQYSLLHLEMNRIYNIQVKVILNDDSESDYSAIITHSTHYDVVASKKQLFNKNSDNNIEFDFSDFTILTIKDVNEVIITDGVSFNDNIITFLNSYLQEINYGVKTYLVITSTGKAVIEIEIYDDRKPHLISSNSITFNNQDIIVLFELYDGQFVSLNGNEITEEDYLIEGNQVTIRKAFIESIFSDPDRTADLILGYHLSANTNEVIGFIFIKRNA